MGKISQAKKSKGQILSFVPTGEYYFNKGLKAFNHHEFYRSLRYFKRAMELEPTDPIIVCQLAIVYTELGEYHHAIKLLKYILDDLDAEKEMVECHYFLANNYAHLGYFKDAYSHANLYLKLQEDGDFIDEAEELLEILTLEADGLYEELYDSDELIVKQEKAKKLLETGNFPEAVKLFKAVIKEFPEYWSAYNNLALAYFYLGEVEKASEMLDTVMERNPGNLHALCNKLVFAYFDKEETEIASLLEGLKKVRPILWEHQFKLGATFALVGDYESAYGWFQKLHKKGFGGEGPFYYWFSYSAYFTGKEDTARKLWKKVIEINPEKEGQEPWNIKNRSAVGLEEYPTLIYKKLESDYTEERLFAIFLASLSEQKEDIFSSRAMTKNRKFSALENQYVSILKKEKTHYNSQMLLIHETAKLLYEHHHPIGVLESGLYLMWFSVAAEMTNEKVNLKNQKAFAAAMEYVWNKLRTGDLSQKQVAYRYELSVATLQKYIKLVKEYLD